MTDNIERIRQFAAYGDTAEGRIIAQLALTEIQAAYRACATIADDAEQDRSNADAPYDNGSGSCGYALACSEIAKAIRAKISGASK